ncbi:OsmC/Ohr family [Exophiala viscosa]|uniref:OsmC/Ohr family n=1 Tax=Exophiala viscosa TaxID=2486360 RepID=A0AAN6E5M2_9EURO|nr:OsmC/Ohr family [Exophiala viscosa]KAI1626764.1 OsmC/Ohr family [Exophiala viscosa]
MSDAATAAAETLRNKQKPLKDKYRSDPSSAFLTLSSSGSLDPTSTSLTCSLSAGTAARKVAGLHQAAGGEGFDASGELCSGDMLLESLVACFGVTVRAVATSLGIPINGGTITTEGDLDFRGTMGIKDPEGNAVPVGFKAIRLIVRLDVDEDHKSKVDKLIQLSERYCVVLQTIKGGVPVETKLGHVGSVMPNARSNADEGADGEGGSGVQDVPPNEDVLKMN